MGGAASVEEEEGGHMHECVAWLLVLPRDRFGERPRELPSALTARLPLPQRFDGAFCHEQSRHLAQDPEE